MCLNKSCGPRKKINFERLDYWYSYDEGFFLNRANLYDFKLRRSLRVIRGYADTNNHTLVSWKI